MKSPLERILEGSPARDALLEKTKVTTAIATLETNLKSTTDFLDYVVKTFKKNPDKPFEASMVGVIERNIKSNRKALEKTKDIQWFD